MTKTLGTSMWAWNAYWPTSSYGFDASDAALPAGVTFQTIVPHPHAGATNLQYVKLDGTLNHRLPLIGAVFANLAPVGGVPTCRKARMISVIMRVTTAPTAETIFFDLNLSGVAVLGKIKTDRTATYYYAGSGITNEIASPPAIPTGTDYQLELWEVFRDSSGNALPFAHILIRYVDLTTFAATNLFESQTAVPANVDFGWASAYIGETAANGGLFYVGTPFIPSLQNADDPIGIVRTEALHPDGVSGMANANQFPGTAGATTIDETPTAVPNDADIDSGAGITNSNTKEQRYTFQNHSIVTGSDTIYFLVSAMRANASAGDKASSRNLQCHVADGTTVGNGGNFSLSTSMTTLVSISASAPGTVAWTTTGIDNTEFGGQFSTTSVGVVTASISVMTAMVVYNKSGETTPAVPQDRVRLKRSLVQLQAVQRAAYK